MAGPKVTVIGAGSFFFGRPVIHKMATSPHMAGGTLALVDTRPEVVATMTALAERIFSHTGCGVKVVGTTDRREVLPGSDFVVLTFSERNAHYRGLDTAIAARHGIRMCSSDTIGPGGIFRALREIPHMVAMAEDVAELCPDAWVINFVNPSTVMAMAMRRYAPGVRSFALCDSHHEPRFTLDYCKRVGIVGDDVTSLPPEVRSRLDFAVGGVNHFTWLIRFRYDGQDMLPRLREVMAERAAAEQRTAQTDAKGAFNDTYGVELMDIFGAWPDIVGHTKEYVPYYQGYGVRAVQPEPLKLFDAVGRQGHMDAAWAVTEQYARGELSEQKFLDEVHDDHATDIIESMWGQLGKAFYIISPNRGAVTNLPADAMLEARSDIDLATGPRPQPIGPMPRGLLALQHVVLDTHELTAEAAMSGDRAILRRAMLTDPICNNVADVDACIADLIDAERDVLPQWWYDSAPAAARR